MSTYELNGIGLPVGNQECDALELFDGESTGISGLMQKAGATVVDDYAAYCLTNDLNELSEYAREAVDEYRRESGRQYPQLYRIKISVEVKPLTDAENDAAWAARQQRE